MSRDVASRAESRTARLLRSSRALPWVAITIVALLALSAPFAIDPVRDADTLRPALDGALHRPAAYLIIAPASEVLDTITLLSARQHLALIGTLALAWALWWWFRARPSDRLVEPARRGVRALARIGTALILLLGLYVAAVLIPRPMAAFDTASPAIIAIDFHAHTKYSHDGRPDWTAEDSREWHRKAGFDVAYLTDHRSFDGAREGWANNPSRSGEQTVLLPAIEAIWRGEHVNVLDADRMYRGILTPALGDVDDQALTLVSAMPGNEPILIETIPGHLDKVVPAKGVGTAGMRAIELVDGSPRGLGQTRTQRARIVSIADSTNMALVAGSDHHGWGHAASAWTLMLLPGWRGASPDELSKAISQILRNGGRNATKVVERYVADTDQGIALPLTVPLVAWGMFRTLSIDERVVWLAWVAAFVAFGRARRMRRRAPA